MAKHEGKKNRRWVSPRLLVQLIVAALSNGYLAGYQKGLYQGNLKKFCVPGLNCYSCPGALGSCPMGSLQAVLGSSGHYFSYYIVGFFLMVGAVFGRFVCGWLCPFGLVQDLLHKTPLPKCWKRKHLPGHKVLVWLKYAILVVFCIVLPLTVVNIIGMGEPWFCKWICPSGTLFGGWSQMLCNPKLRVLMGSLFQWKSAILIVILVGSVFVFRPFCQYICPLGAVYSLFNKVAFYRIRINESACTSCGACQKACPLDIEVYKTPNSLECIRCGQCSHACPNGALHCGFTQGKKKSEE